MRILIIEDDIDLMNGYADVFEDAGHTAVRCASFDQGRAEILTARFDAIVTDVRLAGRNGLGLLIDADSRGRGVRKVVMSGFDDPVLRRDAEALGAVYFVKPVHPDDLVSAVEGRSEHPVRIGEPGRR